jgi:hypothetical protein
MFPCLFPFGYGGLGNKCMIMKINISDVTHKKWLMNHHSKQFQRDLYFPMITFNHEQIDHTGACVQGLMTAKHHRN